MGRGLRLLSALTLQLRRSVVATQGLFKLSFFFHWYTFTFSFRNYYTRSSRGNKKKPKTTWVAFKTIQSHFYFCGWVFYWLCPRCCVEMSFFPFNVIFTLYVFFFKITKLHDWTGHDITFTHASFFKSASFLSGQFLIAAFKKKEKKKKPDGIEPEGLAWVLLQRVLKSGRSKCSIFFIFFIF